MPIDTETTQSSSPVKSATGRRGAIAGFGVLAACALACSLPVIIGAGAVGSIGAFAGGWWIAGAVILAAVVGGGIWWLARRSRSARTAGTASTCDSSCGCGGC